MLYSTQELKMLSEKEEQSGSRVCTRSTTKTNLSQFYLTNLGIICPIISGFCTFNIRCIHVKMLYFH